MEKSETERMERDERRIEMEMRGLEMEKRRLEMKMRRLEMERRRLRTFKGPEPEPSWHSGLYGASMAPGAGLEPEPERRTFKEPEPVSWSDRFTYPPISFSGSGQMEMQRVMSQTRARPMLMSSSPSFRRHLGSKQDTVREPEPEPGPSSLLIRRRQSKGSPLAFTGDPTAETVKEPGPGPEFEAEPGPSSLLIRRRQSKGSPLAFRGDPMAEVEPAGVRYLTPGPWRYSCELTLDTNTVNRNLKLSDNNRKVTLVEEDQPYPDHPERFDYWWQLLCRDGLTGRCYWEVEVRGRVGVAVSYRGISRRGYSDCLFGGNDQSWRLGCSDDEGHYSVCHNKRATFLTSSSVSGRVAVYVDCPAGSLSFYRVSSDSLIHLHTFNTTFTQPLYPGFGVWSPGGSVSLCPL